MRATIACVVAAACGNSPDPGPADASADGPPQNTSFTLRELRRIAGVPANDLEIAGGVLYAKVQSTERMITLDLADPATPAKLGALDPPNVSGATSRLAIAGNRAYIAHESDGVLIADISNPASPTMLGTFTNVYAKDVAIAGNLALIADQDSGLVIADVANPAAPTPVGAAPTAGPFGVAVAGNLAFLADNTGGLAIADISTPASPQVIGGDATIDELRAIAVSGTTVYTLRSSSATDGLLVIDVSAPATPVVRGTYVTVNESDLFLDGAILYICGGSGVEAIDVRDPAAPSPITLGPVQNADAVAAFDNYVYVADGFTGELVVFEKVID